ncbi:MAG: S16 family serine protease [Candidatus Pacearchaeota archaeon]
MEKKYEYERRKIVKNLLLILFILVSLNLFLLLLNEIKDKKNITEENIYQENIIFDTKTKFFSDDNSILVELKVPAVDSEGKGVPTILSVEAKKGTGKTLVDIENLLFWADTQQSIRMARYVASSISNKNVSQYDLIFSVKVKNASIIGGPSAGAAITIATIFALNGEKPREDVIITGTINHDGSIGPISDILEKAKAAKESNARIFLVPLSQSFDFIPETKEHCQTFGTTKICTTETKIKKVNVSKELGLTIIEVENITEALRYFKEK